MEKPMVTKCHVHHNHLKPAKSENLKKWKSLEQIYTYEWPELQGQCNALVTQQPKCGFENARACLWRERANSTWSKQFGDLQFTIWIDFDRFGMHSGCVFVLRCAVARLDTARLHAEPGIKCR